MACDAIARLYDVDEDTAVFERLDKSDKYDQGTFRFKARKGSLINLDKLHESVWATRLSGGTRSGLVSLEVTAVGRVKSSKGKIVLSVEGADEELVLVEHPADSENVGDTGFAAIRASSDGQLIEVTGIINNYSGRWPQLLASKPEKPRQIQVTEFDVIDTQ